MQWETRNYQRTIDAATVVSAVVVVVRVSVSVVVAGVVDCCYWNRTRQWAGPWEVGLVFAHWSPRRQKTRWQGVLAAWRFQLCCLSDCCLTAVAVVVVVVAVSFDLHREERETMGQRRRQLTTLRRPVLLLWRSG